MGRALERKAEILEISDPRRIYVENVRSFFSIPTSLARRICDLGVTTGQFTKHIGYVCPDCQRIVADAPFNSPIDEWKKIECSICDLFEDRDREILVKDCKKQIYYALAEDE